MKSQIPAGKDQAIADETRILIRHEADIWHACKQGKSLAKALGFSDADIARITTAVSELGLNILHHAKEGEIFVVNVERAGRAGLLVEARDQGSGIADPARALEDGFSTKKSVGLGLPGSKRLMDEFDISTEVGKGTAVRTIKWTAKG